MIANAADLIDISKDNLPVSSISVFLTGFVAEIEPVQNDNLFKIIKLNVTEFAGSSQGGPTGKTFYIKCKYLKSAIEFISKKNLDVPNSSIYRGFEPKWRLWYIES